LPGHGKGKESGQKEAGEAGGGSVLAKDRGHNPPCSEAEGFRGNLCPGQNIQNSTRKTSQQIVIIVKASLCAFLQRGRDPGIAPKSLTGDNLRISRGMSEISSFDDSYFLATRAKIWIFYLPSTPERRAQFKYTAASCTVFQ